MSEEKLLNLDDSKLFAKDFKDIKSSFILKKHPFQETQIYVLSVSPDKTKNIIQRISAFRSVPIGGYIYDGISECYLINCLDYLPLGYVSLSYTLSIVDANNWSITIPLPEKVLKRRMSTEQKKELEKFKLIYQDCSFNFIQLIRA